MWKTGGWPDDTAAPGGRQLDLVAGVHGRGQDRLRRCQHPSPSLPATAAANNRSLLLPPPASPLPPANMLAAAYCCRLRAAPLPACRLPADPNIFLLLLEEVEVRGELDSVWLACFEWAVAQCQKVKDPVTKEPVDPATLVCLDFFFFAL